MTKASATFRKIPESATLGAGAAQCPAASKTQKITTLESCRGIAAMMVVFYHASGGLFEHYFGYRPTGWFAFGHAGVDFFFVLSGFVILFVHRGDIGRPGLPLRIFAWRRFARVYPLYWTVTALMAIVALFIPAVLASPEMQPDALLKSFLLWPQERQPLISVAWTLQYEMLFYVVFGTLVINRRLGLGVLAVWMSAVLGVSVFGADSLLLHFIGNPHNAEFLLGMIAALLIRHRSVPRPHAVLGLGVLTFLAAGVAENIFGPIDLIAGPFFGIGAMLTILGLVELERSNGWRAPKSLIFLGAASYSIYLVHLPVLILAAKLTAKLGSGAMLPGVVLLALFIAIGTAAGISYYLLVERPLLNQLRRWGPARGNAPMDATAPSTLRETG